MSGAQEPVGTLEVALAHAAKLLTSDPALAAEQADEMLKVAPGHPVATVILGASHRARGDAPAALAVLEPLARAHPGWVTPHYELGLALGLAGRSGDAVAALRRAVALKPEMGDAWRALGDHLTATAATCRARTRPTRSTSRPRPATRACSHRLRRSATARSRSPRRCFATHLKRFPTDVVAIRMLAEVAARLGRFADSETLLPRCLELAPGFNAARHNYAVVLHRQDRLAEALREVERLLDADPTRYRRHGISRPRILGKLGEVQQSAEIYREVLDEYPQNPKIWQSYGHALKTAGRQSESIAAYRRSIELAPGFGEAYWSLANLKTFRFSAAGRGGHARPARPRRPDHRRPIPLPLRARQGAGGHGGLRAFVRALRRGQPAAPVGHRLRRR